MDFKTRKQVNKLLRSKDDSHLWPIRGEYNATERAIRRVRRFERQGLVIDDVYSYMAIVESEISKIVNSH